jgi:hypothetical protein
MPTVVIRPFVFRRNWNLLFNVSTEPSRSVPLGKDPFHDLQTLFKVVTFDPAIKEPIRAILNV